MSSSKNQSINKISEEKQLPGANNEDLENSKEQIMDPNELRNGLLDSESINGLLNGMEEIDEEHVKKNPEINPKNASTKAGRIEKGKNEILSYSLKNQEWCQKLPYEIEKLGKLILNSNGDKSFLGQKKIINHNSNYSCHLQMWNDKKEKGGTATKNIINNIINKSKTENNVDNKNGRIVRKKKKFCKKKARLKKINNFEDNNNNDNQENKMIEIELDENENNSLDIFYIYNNENMINTIDSENAISTQINTSASEENPFLNFFIGDDDEKLLLKNNELTEVQSNQTGIHPIPAINQINYGNNNLSSTNNSTNH
jgi:hypothetical protein